MCLTDINFLSKTDFLTGLDNKIWIGYILKLCNGFGGKMESFVFAFR